MKNVNEVSLFLDGILFSNLTYIQNAFVLLVSDSGARHPFFLKRLSKIKPFQISLICVRHKIRPAIFDIFKKKKCEKRILNRIFKSTNDELNKSDKCNNDFNNVAIPKERQKPKLKSNLSYICTRYFYASFI